LNTSNQTQQLFGHPKGLFYLFFAELWERFSFYGMRALLMLYMTEEIYRALENRDVVASTIYAAYGALIYATPVLGGMLADRLFGFRRSILLGGMLMALGQFVLAMGTDLSFFTGLGLLIVGNGFFKPNISTFVGALYEQGDERRDSGFTIFYMGINIGAFVAPLFCGWLGVTYGWTYGFASAGFGMALGLIVFYSAIKKGIFGNHGYAPDEAALEKRKFGLKIKQLIPVIAFLTVPIIALMMYYGKLNLPFIGEIDYKGQVVDYVFWVILIVILYVIGKTMKEVSKVERHRLIVIVALTMLMTLFWGFYELAGSTLTLFAYRNINLVWINASQTNAITALYIILFAIPFSWIWVFLSKKKVNPFTPYKFAFGLLLLGFGYLIYAWSGNFSDAAGRVPFAFMLVGYLMFSTGELFMSPVGLSKVTELAPAKIVSFMMGVWFLSSAFAFRLVGLVGGLLAVEGKADETTPLESLLVYTEGFQNIAYVTLVGAALAFLLAPILKKWMHGIH
jgi:POT family proton-dependent oligopeptide transporter